MVSAFWSALDCRIKIGEPPILIDLFHGIAEYLWRNLVVAKFVQRITGAPLVGLLGTPGSVHRIAHNVSRSENMQLARAFGVAHFVDVPDSDAPESMEQSSRAAIAELATQCPDGTPLPPAAISLLRGIRTESGFPIGQNVQETFMGAERQPRVLAGHRLLHWTKRVLGFHAFAEQLVSTMRPSALVTGQLECCPWRNLSEQLLRRGGRIIWTRDECRLPIDLLDHIDESATLNGMIRRIERDSFVEFERRVNGDADLCKRIDALAQARSAAVHNGVGRFWTWAATDKLTSIPATAFDRALPSYCLFTHPFTDPPPAADESLFVDHLEWVEETCRHAAATGSYNLIVKVHPHGRSIDLSDTADRLANAFAGARNIHFTHDLIEPEQLARYCALGLTIRGMPGLEMTSLGLPMILAGRGRYSDTGLCLVPATRSEYFELLEKGPPFPIDITEQSRRARLFIAFDRHWSLPTSELVPAARNGNDTNFWILIADGLRSACLETDQAARALALAWPKGSAKVVAPELDELFNTIGVQ
jgi:hypothetical protein